MKRLLLFTAMATLLVACGNDIPQNFWEADELPNIYPDYTNVTVPINIAPLTFQIDGHADDVVARLSAGEEEIICSGREIMPDADDWKRLTERAKGDAIKVEVYQRVPLINWFGGKLRLFTREKLTCTYYVGSETKDMLGSYMFREGDKVPCVIYIPGFRGFLTPRFVTDPLKWRSHTIVDLDAKAIGRIELEIPADQNESFAVVNNGSGFDFIVGGSKVPAFDTLRVAALIASFTWLNFDEFASIVPNSNDSSLVGMPRTILRITDTAGTTREVRTYIKYANPNDMAVVPDEEMYETFDVNRLYAIVDNTDTVLIQYHVFDNILQPARYFLGADNKTLME